jgi:hypothetical protein
MKKEGTIQYYIAHLARYPEASFCMKFECGLNEFQDKAHYQNFLVRLIHSNDLTGVCEDARTSADREFIALVIR